MSSDRAHLLFLLAASALASSGCLERRDPPAAENACTKCHGDGTRPGIVENQAAPPADLAGNTDPAFPGVGAHQNHLTASATHAAVRCDECHRVPKSTESPGHADTKLPAEINLGTLAHAEGATPTYDGKGYTCAGTYCHGRETPAWTRPRASAEACGTCHSIPPAAPHPQSDQCFRCHGETIGPDQVFVAPEKHVNGNVEVQVGCSTCHGSESSNAPPTDLAGLSDKSSLGVGAHQAHLAGGANSLAVSCETCHVVPAAVEDPGHLDDGTPNAEVTFAGVALTDGRNPSWDRTAATCAESWCHGPSSPTSAPSPEWTLATGPLNCTTCHGSPPPAPHPQMDRCSFCHSNIAADNTSIIDRNLHVNGIVDVTPPTTCYACHGSAASPAPPQDLSGSMSTLSPGVGAHQRHINGSATSRPVECAECHLVPTTLLDPGHVDTAGGAELTFSGVALSFGATPAYDSATNQCANTYCHGAMFVSGHPSGGTNTQPDWTSSFGSGCNDNCHLMPPPSPGHPSFPLPCSDCHVNLNPDQVTFIDPSLHINGVVN